MAHDLTLPLAVDEPWHKIKEWPGDDPHKGQDYCSLCRRWYWPHWSFHHKGGYCQSKEKKMSLEEEGKQAYEAISNMVNGGTARKLDAFVDAFLSDHNTLQQQAVATFLTALVKFAEQDERWVDARNEFAYELANKVKDVLVADGRVLIRDGQVRLALI